MTAKQLEIVAYGMLVVAIIALGLMVLGWVHLIKFGQ